jgi:hypothetical protein
MDHLRSDREDIYNSTVACATPDSSYKAQRHHIPHRAGFIIPEYFNLILTFSGLFYTFIP